ncbi:MAG: hypothetical protein ACPGVP_21380, partial [Thiolinea sp.]
IHYITFPTDINPAFPNHAVNLISVISVGILFSQNHSTTCILHVVSHAGLRIFIKYAAKHRYSTHEAQRPSWKKRTSQG